MPASYPLDTTGLNSASLVENEVHTLTEVNANPYRLIVPTYAPFYLDHLEVEHIASNGTITTLVEGVHYNLSLIYLAASRSIGKMLYGSIVINTNFLNGVINLKKYQTLGGSWTADPNYVLSSIAAQVYNPRITAWDNVTNVQAIFPPINHDQNLDYVFGYQDLINALQQITTQIAAGPSSTSGFIQHLITTQSPSHVGLGDVANIATATDVEVSNADVLDKHVASIQSQINALQTTATGLGQTDGVLQSQINAHIGSSNAHTKASVGLSDVVNLPIATDLEVANLSSLDKYITLKQLVSVVSSIPRPDINYAEAMYLGNR
jgi:hypothetical protein